MGLKLDYDKIRNLLSEISSAFSMLNELSDLSKKDFLGDPYKVARAKYFLIF